MECSLAKILSVALLGEANEATPVTVSKKVPRNIPRNHSAEVELLAVNPIAIESFDSFPPFSQFILRNKGKTIASGSCIKLMIDVANA